MVTFFLSGDPAGKSSGRFLDLVHAAVEAQAEKRLAAGAEGRTWRETDIGLVYDAHRRLSRIRYTIPREEQVERPGRHGEPRAARGVQRLANQVAHLARMLDVIVQILIARIERRHSAALHE